MCKQITRNSILYLGNFCKPNVNAAGKRVYGISLILESLGYDVLMLGKASDGNEIESIALTDHIKYKAIPNYREYDYVRYFNYVKKIVINEKPTYIIRYSSLGLSFFDAKLLALAHKLNIPVIADVVDWLLPEGPNVFFKTIKRIDTYLEKGFFNCKSDGVIAISNYLAEYYKKKGNEVLIIPPVVLMHETNISKNEICNIVYAGMPFRKGIKINDVHKIKDRLDLTIEVFYNLFLNGNKSFCFKIFGLTKTEYLIGFPHHKIMLEQLIENVFFMGNVPMEIVHKEIGKADFTILLREKNRGTLAGFPTKVVESISLGTPVITTITSDLSQYVIDGHNGFLVDISNFEECVRQIDFISKLPVKDVATMKRNCFADEQFVFNNYINSMKTFLTKIID